MEYSTQILKIIDGLRKLHVGNMHVEEIVEYISLACDEFYEGECYEDYPENDNMFVCFYREHEFCPEQVAFALIMMIVREKSIDLANLRLIYGSIGNINDGIFQEMLKDEIFNSYSKEEIKAFRKNKTNACV